MNLFTYQWAILCCKIESHFFCKDIIDSDALLEEEDLQRPDTGNLKSKNYKFS